MHALHSCAWLHLTDQLFLPCYNNNLTLNFNILCSSTFNWIFLNLWKLWAPNCSIWPFHLHHNDFLRILLWWSIFFQNISINFMNVLFFPSISKDSCRECETEDAVLPSENRAVGVTTKEGSFRGRSVLQISPAFLFRGPWNLLQTPWLIWWFIRSYSRIFNFFLAFSPPFPVVFLTKFGFRSFAICTFLSPWNLWFSIFKFVSDMGSVLINSFPCWISDLWIYLHFSHFSFPSSNIFYSGCIVLMLRRTTIHDIISKS